MVYFLIHEGLLFLIILACACRIADVVYIPSIVISQFFCTRIVALSYNNVDSVVCKEMPQARILKSLPELTNFY